MCEGDEAFLGNKGAGNYIGPNRVTLAPCPLYSYIIWLKIKQKRLGNSDVIESLCSVCSHPYSRRQKHKGTIYYSRVDLISLTPPLVDPSPCSWTELDPQHIQLAMFNIPTCNSYSA